MKTLAEARKDFKEKIKGDGTRCPCCHRWGKINGYQITSTQVWGMIWMLKRFRRNQWIEIAKAPKLILRSKSLATLHHWELLERQPNVDPDKKGSGFWRLTQKGRDFVRHKITVPKYAFVFDNKLIKFSRQHTNVIAALGKKFSYQELMSTKYKDTK